jgi:hypothetical protein
MTNITLSADKPLIDQARILFEKRGTTLNAEFRKWISAQTKDEGQRRRKEFEEMMKKMPKISIGRKLTREEMNER